MFSPEMTLACDGCQNESLVESHVVRRIRGISYCAVCGFSDKKDLHSWSFHAEALLLATTALLGSLQGCLVFVLLSQPRRQGLGLSMTRYM